MNNKKQQIAVSLGKVFSGNILLTLLNLIRDLSIAAFFGASLLSDYYFLAIMFPVFFNTVLVGAYRSTIIPFLEEQSVRARGKIPNLISILNGSILRALVVLGGLFAIVTWLTLWFMGKENIYVSGISVVYLFIGVIPVYALSGYLECNVAHMQFRRYFFFGSILRLGLPIGAILGCFLISSQYSIYALPIGGAIGVFVCLFVLGHWQYRQKYIPTFSKHLENGYGRRIIYSMAALSIGTSMAYINPIVDQLVAATLGEGSIALLGYSNRLATGLSSVTAGAIGSVLLVYYSNIAAASNHRAKLQELFNKAFVLCCWLSCALVVVVASYAVDMVSLVYTHGSMTGGDSFKVGRLLQYYSCQYLPLITSAVVYPLISALNLNKIFVPINLALCVINLIADIILSKYFGLAGIAISTVVVYSVSLVSMVVYLSRKGYIDVAKSTYSNMLVAILLAVIVYYFSGVLKNFFDISVLGVNLPQIVVITLYGLLVLWVCKVNYKKIKPKENI